MVRNNKARHQAFSPGKRARIQWKKALLLFLEVVAVIGLLFAAHELWQTQQALQQDLRTAQEIQAIIGDDPIQTGVTTPDGRQDSALPLSEGQTPDGNGTQRLQASPFLRGDASQIGAGDG